MVMATRIDALASQKKDWHAHNWKTYHQRDWACALAESFTESLNHWKFFHWKFLHLTERLIIWKLFHWKSRHHWKSLLKDYVSMYISKCPLSEAYLKIRTQLCISHQTDVLWWDDKRVVATANTSPISTGMAMGLTLLDLEWPIVMRCWCQLPVPLATLSCLCVLFFYTLWLFKVQKDSEVVPSHFTERPKKHFTESINHWKLFHWKLLHFTERLFNWKSFHWNLKVW
jgi:hypothetical protein